MEAYRGLRTYVALWGPEKGADDGHRVIVVTSPSAGRGEDDDGRPIWRPCSPRSAGRSWWSRPTSVAPGSMSTSTGPASPGLVDILSGTPGAPTFEDLDLSTSVRGVRLIASGPPTENPAPLLEHAGDLLRAARGLADFVLVDTPPLLVANDAVDLARHADGVLLVARAGDDADRSGPAQRRAVGPPGDSRRWSRLGRQRSGVDQVPLLLVPLLHRAGAKGSSPAELVRQRRSASRCRGVPRTGGAVPGRQRFVI